MKSGKSEVISLGLGHRPSSLSRHRHLPDHLLVLKNSISDEDFRMFNIYSSKNDGWSAEVLCPPFMKNRPCVVSVCQGIVCLTYSLDVAAADADIEAIGQFLLWNPSTQKYKVIPSPSIPFPPCRCSNVNDEDHDSGCTSVTLRAASGLGFEPRSGDYKILIFRSIIYSGQDHDIHSSFSQICIYSLKENSWKEIKNSKYSNVRGYSICLDGVLYFNTYKKDHVVAFDLATEEFSTIPFPDVLLARGSSTFLVEFNGSLAFVVSTFHIAAKCFRIWILDVVDGVRVWVKKSELNMCGFGAPRTPLGSCNNGRSFFLQGRDGTLLEYNFLTRAMKSVQQFFGYPPASSRLFSYVESTAELC